MSGMLHIITDFRHLNSRLIRLNYNFSSVGGAIQILGASECELMSGIDMGNAYCTLRISAEWKNYCGIVV